MDDKELIMNSVRGLISLHEDYGLTTLSAFITKMVACPVDDYNVYAAVLRKFGHQILNRLVFQDVCLNVSNAKSYHLCLLR